MTAMENVTVCTAGVVCLGCCSIRFVRVCMLKTTLSHLSLLTDLLKYNAAHTKMLACLNIGTNANIKGP